MHRFGTNGEGNRRGEQLANPIHQKMELKWCVCVSTQMLSYSQYTESQNLADASTFPVAGVLHVDD